MWTRASREMRSPRRSRCEMCLHPVKVLQRVLLPLLLLSPALCAAADSELKAGVFSPARAAPDFSLRGSDGAVLKLNRYRGKVVILAFGFTSCPDVCPTTLFEVSEILRALGPDADRTRALFITVDPERDTAPIMKDYLSSFDPHLLGVTGDPAAIAAVAKAYRVYYKKVPLDEGGYTMDHTAIVYLMDKNGRFVAPFSLKRTTEAAAADLRRYL